MYYKDLAELLRAKMAENNFSTYDIAKLSGDKLNANTITRIINGNIQEAKLSTLTAIAEAFKMPIEDVVNAALGRDTKPTRYELYAEHFDAADLSESEWQWMEVHFNDQINRFRREKIEWRDRILAEAEAEQRESKIAARISPGDEAKIRREIQRTITPDEETEIVKRLDPRKRKTG